jgi:hypothetical protein
MLASESKERLISTSYVSMLALCRAILLVRVWTRYVMGDTHMLEEGGELLILTSSIRLNGQDFLVEEPLNKLLELFEFLEHIRHMFQKI